MYHVSAHGFDERMIDLHYWWVCFCFFVFLCVYVFGVGWGCVWVVFFGGGVVVVEDTKS